MTLDQIREDILAAWRRNNRILLYLLDHVPAGGLEARPAGSKGRDVIAQFAHLEKVRQGWIQYFRTGRRPALPRYDRNRPPPRAQVRKALARSGRTVETLLEGFLRGEDRPRMFGRSPMRWLSYLMAHDAHHRGQILLALKQSGHRLPESIATQGLWGAWILGK